MSVEVSADDITSDTAGRETGDGGAMMANPLRRAASAKTQSVATPIDAE
jgi:hypothetical protein